MGIRDRFHGNLVHGSAGNITPYPRKIVYLTLNAVSNYIRTVSYTHLRAHETVLDLVCRLLLEKKKQ